MKKNNKNLNKKKIITLIIIFIVIILFVAIGVLYENNDDVKIFLDKYVFFKEKHENNLPKIEITSSEDLSVYSFGGNVLILKNNLVSAYNSNGNEVYSLDIEISNPIFKASGDYLVIAEKNGNKIYVIQDKNILWKKDLEGNIVDVTVNSNGYLAVSTTGAIYKTIIQVFNNKGEEQFKNFLSTTYIVDMSISPDNKYLAIAETNFSGILIQSNIKIISMEKAKNGDNDSIIYTYSNKEGDLILNIQYQDKDELVCIYDDHIELIKDKLNSVISDFSNEEVLFADLNNKIIKIIKKDTKTYLNVMDKSAENSREYEISEPKEIMLSNQIVAINLGSEVLFYNNSGWLIKKYYANQEINNIVLCDNLAGIVYSDKIEIVSL